MMMILPSLHLSPGAKFFLFLFLFFKINFFTSKQTITITRTVQLVMHDTKSDEEMDYKKRITERVEPNGLLLQIVYKVLFPLPLTDVKNVNNFVSYFKVIYM